MNITQEGLNLTKENKGRQVQSILDLIGELVKNTPNDKELGKEVRRLYNQINKTKIT